MYPDPSGVMSVYPGREQSYFSWQRVGDKKASRGRGKARQEMHKKSNPIQGLLPFAVGKLF